MTQFHLWAKATSIGAVVRILFGLAVLIALQSWTSEVWEPRSPHWSKGGWDLALANGEWLQVLANPSLDRAPLGERAIQFTQLREILEVDPDFYGAYRLSGPLIGVALDDAEGAVELLRAGVNRRDSGRVHSSLLAGTGEWINSWELDAHLGFFLALEMNQLAEGIESLRNSVRRGAPKWLGEFAENLATDRGRLFAYWEWLSLQVRLRERQKGTLTSDFELQSWIRKRDEVARLLKAKENGK